MDRRPRGPARRRRRAQRRRPAAEPEARQLGRGARRPEGDERGAVRAALRGRRRRDRALARGAGLARRPRPSRRPTSSWRLPRGAVHERASGSSTAGIRLLLAVLACSSRRRSDARSGCRPSRRRSLARLAAGQHRQTVEVPAGARNDLRPHRGPSSRSASRRRPSTPTRADPEPARVAGAPRGSSGSTKRRCSRARRPHAGFVYIARQADPERLRRSSAASSTGSASTEERRAYPQRPVAAHVLGYAGVDNRGLAGTRAHARRALVRAAPGSETIVKDPFGRAIDIVDSTPSATGGDVFLTLDHTLQANAEAVLRETVKRWHAKAASAIVIDPRTGGILAMAVAPASTPTASPTPPTDARNRAVTDTYEPGSTFKLVTVAGACRRASSRRSRRSRCRTRSSVADRVIHDADERGTETMTVDADPLALLERRHDHAGAGARPDAPRPLDRPVRLRPADGRRLPRRERRDRAASRAVVGLHHRQRPDRPGHRRHADADGGGLRVRRERRRAGAAASGRPDRRPTRRSGPAGRGSSRSAWRTSCSRCCRTSSSRAARGR